MNLPFISKLALITILSLLTCARPYFSNNWTISCNGEEREGLMKFKQSLQDPYNLLSSWKGNDCCRWSGVTCHKVTRRIIKLELQELDLSLNYIYEKVPIRYNFSDAGELIVSQVTLFGCNMNEKFKPFCASEINLGLVSLRYLSHLDLSGIWYAKNTVVPEFFASIKWLRHLHLQAGGFDFCTYTCDTYFPTSQKDAFEHYVCCVVSFHHLVVDNVQWLSHLQALRSLEMSGVAVQKPFEFMRVLNQLPSLSALGLSNCELDSNHLSYFNSTFPARLQYLDLSSNFFSGYFEEGFGNMTSLQYLDLSGNVLRYPTLMWLSNLESLIHIDLSGTMIDNVIEVLLSLLQNNRRLKSLILSDSVGLNQRRFPRFHYNSSKSIEDEMELLDLSFNDLADVNLTSLGRLRRLESLCLAGNMLEGNILELLPNPLQALVNLKMLDLSSNRLEGTIPPTISKLMNLESLCLDNNHLNGSIPVSLGTLPNLKAISFSNNRLEGTIPESLGLLQALRFLDISFNHLNGSIPKTIGQLANLVSLNLHNNSLNGIVSEAHFSTLSKLKLLNIGLNDLICKISSNWFPPFRLWYINLGSCKFETELPEWIKSQKKAYSLVLSNAHIQGPIPKWFENMQFVYLDLSNNRIIGHLSNVLPNSRYLDLSNNSISECLPPSISEIIPSMTFLDLSRNNLTGNIPDCWGNGSSLQLIDFSSNKLSGNIPKSMGQLSSLSFLLLHNNSLNGQIPEVLQNCAHLAILDLGENNFSGNLPSWIGTNLTVLRILRLRGNKFYGSIPWQFCSLDQLQILDLGVNNLTGNIPPCLHRIGSMNGTKEDGWDQDVFEDRWDQEIGEMINGRYIEYTKNILILLNLDLSSNHLVGSIPREIFSLSMLLGLNLSHNNLTGNIANDVKDMISLESLDLSNNQLSGPIPQGMSSLSQLSHLNLANNNLRGQVPQGTQLQTIYAYDPSIYDGNPLLCGDPLPQECNEAEAPPAGRTKPLKGRKELIMDEAILFMITAFGYATGLWGVILVLIIKKSWRVAYFKFADDTVDKAYVAIAVKMAKIRRRWSSSA